MPSTWHGKLGKPGNSGRPHKPVKPVKPGKPERHAGNSAAVIAVAVAAVLELLPLLLRSVETKVQLEPEACESQVLARDIGWLESRHRWWFEPPGFKGVRAFMVFMVLSF